MGLPEEEPTSQSPLARLCLSHARSVERDRNGSFPKSSHPDSLILLGSAPNPGSRSTVGQTQQAHVLDVGSLMSSPGPDTCQCFRQHHQAFAEVPEPTFLTFLKPSICSLGPQHYYLLIKGPCSITKQLQFLKKAKGSQRES